MKTLRVVVIALLCCLAVLPSVSAAPARPRPHRLVGKVVLRLRFRGETSDPMANPYKMGSFEVGDPIEVDPQFVGTGIHGGIYILNPMTDQYSILERFSQSGRLLYAWQPAAISTDTFDGTGNQYCVTRDGYVWICAEGDSDGDIRGLPITVFQRGRKSPSQDWNAELPNAIYAAIEKVLRPRNLIWYPGWRVDSIQSGGDIVSLVISDAGAMSLKERKLMQTSVVSSDEPIHTLRLVMNTAGTKVFNAQILPHAQVVSGSLPILESDGRFWNVHHEESAHKKPAWCGVTVSPVSGGPGRVLIPYNKNSQPFAPEVRLDKTVGPPDVQLMANGIIELSLTKGNDPFPSSPTYTPHWHDAVVFLDRHNHVISYLPWTPDNSLGDSDMPLADGAGFYDFQMDPKELTVTLYRVP